MNIRLDREINEVNRARLLSLGFGEAQARQTAKAQTLLMQGISRLAGLKEEGRDGKGGTEDIIIAGGGSTDQDNYLGSLENAVLSEDWKNFAGALSSVAPADEGYIKLFLQRVQIGQEVSDLLLQSFHKAPPIQRLTLFKNGPGAVHFAARALEANPTFELAMKNNPITSESDAISFARSVGKLPRDASYIALVQCSLGHNNAVMAAIVPTLLDGVKEVYLEGNCIGTEGARLISDSLACNPSNLEQLCLRNNRMGNDAAKLLAESLKTNNKLRLLRLEGNPITFTGVQTLLISICGGRRDGLNGRYESNHTCRISFCCRTSKHNRSSDPNLNRKLKMLRALLPGDEDYTNIRHLDDVPVGAMPKVLGIVQEDANSGVSAPVLDRVYQLCRQWSMPLLYVSRRTGPEPRRSERLRKKSVLELIKRKPGK